ncbi:MAG: ankyrin repeat domain-containing protein [Rickettsiales bacterium]
MTIFDLLSKGDSKAVLTLIKDRPKLVHVRDENQYTPLHWAVAKGPIELVEALIKEKADLEVKDYQEKTPLHVAALSGTKEVVGILIGAGAKKEARDNQKQTPLHMASAEGHIEVVKVLLAEGADKEARDKWEYTPLHWAVCNNHIELVKFLLGVGGVDTAAVTDQGKTALAIARQENYTQVIEVLALLEPNLPVAIPLREGAVSAAVVNETYVERRSTFFSRRFAGFIGRGGTAILPEAPEAVEAVVTRIDDLPQAGPIGPHTESVLRARRARGTIGSSYTNSPL